MDKYEGSSDTHVHGGLQPKGVKVENRDPGEVRNLETKRGR